MLIKNLNTNPTLPQPIQKPLAGDTRKSLESLCELRQKFRKASSTV